MGRTYLYVPPEEYAAVEDAGASWDDHSKRWYVTGEVEADVQRWTGSRDAVDIFNICADEAFVVSAKISCFQCRTETEVICLFGETGRDVQSGQEIERFTLSNVAAVDARLHAQLGRWPNYRPAESTGESAFVNRCSRCGAAQDDYLLHSEPGDVFFGISRESPRDIEFFPLEGVVQLRCDYSMEL